MDYTDVKNMNKGGMLKKNAIALRNFQTKFNQ
jgi:hypothetical protein